MLINKTDVIWNYAATVLRIASYAFLLPFILRTMPSEMVGIWSVFMTINSFAFLLDMGFSPSFTRNITYIFSGVKTLKTTGFYAGDPSDRTIDYSLLKGMISAMKWCYIRMAIILLVLLSTFGTYYLYAVLKNYNGPKAEIYISWVVLCLICTYNIYTQYLDCLLQGKGLIKRSKQIVILGQSVYLLIAAIFIMAKFGLLAIVSAQAISVIIIRYLTSQSFFTKQLKQKLLPLESIQKKVILKMIYPNALKVGLTSFGAFVIQKSSILIGSLLLPLSDIASYGVSVQLIYMISNLSLIYSATYIPKIVQLRIEQDNFSIKHLYIKSLFVLVITYVTAGFFLLVAGNFILLNINSKTQLLQNFLLLVALLISFLESNHSIAGTILLTKNEVPFFKSSLFAGAFTILLLLLMLYYTNLGLAAMVLAPGFAQLYNNYKWPYELIKQLKITRHDIQKSFINIFNHAK